MKFPGELYAVGSTGTSVREIQRELNSKGYNVGTADGIFGNGTEEGVKSFQKDNRLKVDGIVGKLTWDKLFNDSSAVGNHPYPGVVLGVGSAGPNVELVQRFLNRQGYNAGTADGIFGNGTRQAVISFQQDHFITADGLVGEVTWNILFKGTANGIGATYPGHLLRRGSQGDSVKIIQNQLNRLGFNVGVADGIFGAGTESGVRSYQQSRNLTVDGLVGQETWNKLMSDSQGGENVNNNTPYPNQLLSRGTTGSHVRVLQQRLNELNFFVGLVDGIFGAKTEEKVRAFQSSKELTVDGIVGRLTWDALFNNTTANVSIPFPGTLLAIGSSGSDVRRVQTQLNSMGYNAGTVDGIFGQQTANAVKGFQLANNLDRDGIVGRLTWNALFNGIHNPTPGSAGVSYPGSLIREGDRGENVRLIQERLILLGYSLGTADGIFGIRTKNAVRAFQHDRGLDVDGIVGSMTWNSLFSISHPGNKGGAGAGIGDGTIDRIRKIYIDPGHGGYDSGAVGNGLYEKDIVLDISRRQRQKLVEAGYIVRMSRDSDVYRTLAERTREANDWGADLFISNHVNAGGGVGAEVFHSIYGGPGKTIAERVMSNLTGIFRSRGTKSRQGQNGDYYHVIREAHMPSILLEHGFIDNVEDANILKSATNRQRMADATVNAIKSLSPIESNEKVNITPSSYLAKIFNVTKELVEGNRLAIGAELPFIGNTVKMKYEAYLEREGSINWNLTKDGISPNELLESFANKGLREIKSAFPSPVENEAVAIASSAIRPFTNTNIEEVRYSFGSIDAVVGGFRIRPFKLEILYSTGYDGWMIREVITLDKEMRITKDQLSQFSAGAVLLVLGLLVLFGITAVGGFSVPVLGASSLIIGLILAKDILLPETS